MADIDISIQSHKSKFPFSCLTKLRLVTTPRAVEFLVGKIDTVLKAIGERKTELCEPGRKYVLE